MTRRERLMATLQGRPVDRPAVSFYEIGGFTIDPADADPYNIYNDPSWRPLLKLAEEQTDQIWMRTPQLRQVSTPYFTTETREEGESRLTRTTVRVAGRTLTSLTRRDRAVNTLWVTEHLLKDVEDLKAYLEIPDEAFAEEVDVAELIADDRRVGDRGIVMVDTPDPICLAAAAPRLWPASFPVTSGASTGRNTPRNHFCPTDCLRNTCAATPGRWLRWSSVTADLRGSTVTAASGGSSLTS
jgi:hypothetical protein